MQSSPCDKHLPMSSSSQTSLQQYQRSLQSSPFCFMSIQPEAIRYQLHPSGMEQDSASLLAVQRGKFIPFGSITGGISSCVCFKHFLFPLLLQSQGGQAWIRWMLMGMDKQVSSQSPTVPGFSEVLHDTSLELCEANGRLPLWLLCAHSSTRWVLEAQHGLPSAETKSSSSS